MQGRDKFNRFIKANPHDHTFLTNRPFLSRRHFFQAAGLGFGGFMLPKSGFTQNTGVVARGNPELLNKAKNVIFILLQGAPSQADTFDFRTLNGVTPASFTPEQVNGILWPTGLMPKLALNLPDMVIARSVRAWALQHELSQAWAQIGRSPAGALGEIAPNTGTIVSIEKKNERRPTDSFPSFLGLNANGMIGAGYLNASYGPVKFTPAQSGFPDTVNGDGQTRFENKWNVLNTLDSPLRIKSPYAQDMEDFDGYYKEARALMYNPKADAAFRFTAQESARYGDSGFGNACLTAVKVLKENAGTRYIQINLGNWDHHFDIYTNTELPLMTRQLDNGLSTLIADLKSSGLFNDTLIVMMGEFGRTVGALSDEDGRDHYLQQFAVFAGAGIKGGRTIGSTEEDGAFTKEFGWYKDRDIRAEDIESTIYYAMGINYTNIRYDDPFNRGFEYIPYGEEIYGPIKELWQG